jgi:glutamyl-tRNA synthetase
MTVITRFPPSPTGFMHIGNARTALYSWLYAKHKDGKFILRIEDTDRKRYKPEYVEAILEAMQWLGLEHDGEVTSQFDRRDRHIEVAQTLLDSGQAYYCYCSPDELEAMREKARADGTPTFYDRRWRDKGRDDAPEGIDPVVRIKAPLSGSLTIHDEVQGEITVQSDVLDDFIILRSDGTPTYMLSVVVDDHDAGVTHIIRGDDHINNAFRQNIILNAMGWDIPAYAHLPLILGPDGAKMSKRHGAATVDEYKALGYLPEAMCNYLLRLGWSHGDDEIISTTQAIEWFDFDSVQKSAARFDFAKLENLNAHYIKQADNNRLVDLTIDVFKSRDIEIHESGRAMLLAGMDELKDRAKTILQLADEGAFYMKKTPYEFDSKAKDLLNSDVLKALHDTIDAVDNFSSETVQGAVKTLSKEIADGKMGKIAMPFRAALTGTTVSPSIFSAAEILGKEETLARINYALSSS